MVPVILLFKRRHPTLTLGLFTVGIFGPFFIHFSFIFHFILFPFFLKIETENE